MLHCRAILIQAVGSSELNVLIAFRLQRPGSMVDRALAVVAALT